MAQYGAKEAPESARMSVHARPKPDIDTVLAALADPVRRRAIELLGQSPRRAGELAALLDLTAPAMSRHLKELKTSGLVAETHPEFDSRVRIYALDTGRLAKLKDWLARAEEGWSAQLAAFRSHVAERQKPDRARKRQRK
jgi:DNA-binding transcriptional ArsR family regulator